jgi:uncharacterized protein (DUF2062 family)
MANDLMHLDKLVLTRLMRLNATVHGIVTGLIMGLGICFATNWLVLKGGDVVGPHLSLLGQFFIGYQVNFVGSLIGSIYGFACGYVIGYGITRMYNRIVDLREGKRSTIIP